jgi:glycosyltransferase involved in cell wall biosynthesis
VNPIESRGETAPASVSIVSGPRRVAHLDTGLDWRGGQAQVFLLMQGLAQRGIENVLIAPRAPLLERARTAGFTTVSWRARGEWDVAALFAAMAELKRHAPDVAHCHTARAHALGVPAARAAQVKVVVVSRRVAVPVHRGLRGLKYRMAVDRYLCVSHNVRAAMRAAGVPEERLLVVRSGVALEPGNGTDLRRELGLPADTPLVGTAAALTAEKRHQDLLEAAGLVRAALPDVHFVWAGDGERRAALERERDARGLGACVHFLGFRPRAAALMAQCTVVALASDLEGLGTSIIEAQAAGVPVVATAVGGVPEVVRDGITGRLVPPRDPRALAAALVDLLRRPDERARMGRAAASGAAEFHIDWTVERTLDAYRDAWGKLQKTA